MQIVSLGDNLHEMLPIFWDNLHEMSIPTFWDNLHDCQWLFSEKK